MPKGYGHLGAFTQLDDQLGQVQLSASLNRYLYAGANPTSLTDPDGHSFLSGTDTYSSSRVFYTPAPTRPSAGLRSQAAIAHWIFPPPVPRIVPGSTPSGQRRLRRSAIPAPTGLERAVVKGGESVTTFAEHALAREAKNLAQAADSMPWSIRTALPKVGRYLGSGLADFGSKAFDVVGTPLVTVPLSLMSGTRWRG